MKTEQPNRIYFDRWNKCFREVCADANNSFATKQEAIDAYKHEMEREIERLKRDIVETARRLSRIEDERNFAAMLTPASRDALPVDSRI